MGTGGRDASSDGRDYVEVQAAARKFAQLDVRALWLSQGNAVVVTVDDNEPTMLGTVLPAEDAGRRFRSKAGGKIQVLLVTDKPKSLSFFSMAVSAVCDDGIQCGAHGTCVNGSCDCEDLYIGLD